MTEIRKKDSLQQEAATRQTARVPRVRTDGGQIEDDTSRALTPHSRSVFVGSFSDVVFIITFKRMCSACSFFVLSRNTAHCGLSVLHTLHFTFRE
jgi:hypothetical protein